MPAEEATWGFMSGIGAGLISGALTVPWDCSFTGTSATITPEFGVAYDPGTYECTNLFGFDSLMYSQSEATVVAFAVAVVVTAAVWGLSSMFRARPSGVGGSV